MVSEWLVGIVETMFFAGAPGELVIDAFAFPVRQLEFAGFVPEEAIGWVSFESVLIPSDPRHGFSLLCWGCGIGD